LNPFPRKAGLKEWLTLIAPGITMMLGSIPRQDVFRHRASNQGALAAIALGISTWLITEYDYEEKDLGSLAGQGFSLTGMVAGSLLPGESA
jgi:hypothetical protein